MHKIATRWGDYNSMAPAGSKVKEGCELAFMLPKTTFVCTFGGFLLSLLGMGQIEAEKALAFASAWRREGLMWAGTTDNHDERMLSVVRKLSVPALDFERSHSLKMSR